MRIRAFVLAAGSDPVQRPPVLHFRPMGSAAEWDTIPMQLKMHGRTVFEAVVPAKVVDADFEYFVSWTGAKTEHVWPAAGESQPHTVIVLT